MQRNYSAFARVTEKNNKIMRISRWCTCTAGGDSKSEWEAETGINRLIGLNGVRGQWRKPTSTREDATPQPLLLQHFPVYMFSLLDCKNTASPVNVEPSPFRCVVVDGVKSSESSHQSRPRHETETNTGH